MAHSKLAYGITWGTFISTDGATPRKGLNPLDHAATYVLRIQQATHIDKSSEVLLFALVRLSNTKLTACAMK
jgi:hypothetical protein